MKLKRSHKTKDKVAAASLTQDAHRIKHHDGSLSSSLEDEEEDDDGKLEIKKLGEASLGSFSFQRHDGNENSYYEEIRKGGPRKNSGVVP